jgi:hypothetical protein
MTYRIPTQCRACARLRKGALACEAFPGGIPNAIVQYGGDHRVARKGDQGLRFQLAEGEGAAEAFDQWLFVNDHAEWEARHRADT